jgi:hypothetical protein
MDMNFDCGLTYEHSSVKLDNIKGQIESWQCGNIKLLNKGSPAKSDACKCLGFGAGGNENYSELSSTKCHCNYPDLFCVCKHNMLQS